MDAKNILNKVVQRDANAHLTVNALSSKISHILYTNTCAIGQFSYLVLTKSPLTSDSLI